MKRASLLSFCYYGFLLLLLPSCGRIVDWGKKTFYQGQDLVIDYGKAKDYIRTINVYDQLTTIANFDVLWLSDTIRTLYATIYTNLAERTQEQKKVLIQRQLDENGHFVIFYALIPYDMPFGNATSQWTIFMSIDNVYYDPIEIKQIELHQIYKGFFGNRYNRFRNVYQIKFDAQDINNNQLITPNTKEIQLHFRTIQKALALTWNLPELAEQQQLEKVCNPPCNPPEQPQEHPVHIQVENTPGTGNL